MFRRSWKSCWRKRRRHGSRNPGSARVSPAELRAKEPAGRRRFRLPEFLRSKNPASVGEDGFGFEPFCGAREFKALAHERFEGVAFPNGSRLTHINTRRLQIGTAA